MTSKGTKKAAVHAIENASTGAAAQDDGAQVYTLRKPKEINGALVTTLTMREMTGADYIAVDDEVAAKIAASGGKYAPGDLARVYHLAARGVGLNYNDFVTMCPADCTYLVAMVNKAGGF